MKTDTLIVGALAALNFIAVTVTDLVTHDVPSVLVTSLTVLVGATAGVAYSGNVASANAGDANATLG